MKPLNETQNYPQRRNPQIAGKGRSGTAAGEGVAGLLGGGNQYNPVPAPHIATTNVRNYKI
jgi:hypothetical protein